MAGGLLLPIDLGFLFCGPGKPVQFGEQPIGYSSEIPHAFQGNKALWVIERVFLLVADILG